MTLYLFWISKYMLMVVIWLCCGLPWRNGTPEVLQFWTSSSDILANSLSAALLLYSLFQGGPGRIVPGKDKLMRNIHGQTPLYQTAICLMEEVGCQASDYAKTCVCPDENKNNPENCSMSDNCDVYVWGSNSSHQLAEGSQEKILTPKLAPAFGNCQQVSADLR